MACWKTFMIWYQSIEQFLVLLLACWHVLLILHRRCWHVWPPVLRSRRDWCYCTWHLGDFPFTTFYSPLIDICYWKLIATMMMMAMMVMVMTMMMAMVMMMMRFILPRQCSDDHLSRADKVQYKSCEWSNLWSQPDIKRLPIRNFCIAGKNVFFFFWETALFSVIFFIWHPSALADHFVTSLSSLCHHSAAPSLLQNLPEVPLG